MFVPLKRFRFFILAVITWLKPAANEMGARPSDRPFAGWRDAIYFGHFGSLSTATTGSNASLFCFKV